jgi:hypothetical protein
MTYPPLRRQSRFEGSFRQRRARLLRAIAAAGSLPDADADAEALVSLVRDGLAEVRDGHARLPGGQVPGTVRDGARHLNQAGG